MRLIERYVEAVHEEGLIFRDIMFREEVLISAAQIHERFYSLDASLSIPNRMQLVAEWLKNRIKTFGAFGAEKKPWVEEEMQFFWTMIFMSVLIADCKKTERIF
ncbi:hypothetical protein GCM10020331_083690 [Ectobacillus funiculus]